MQRSRTHKVRNILGHLPKAQHEQARSTLRAAWKLEADEGIRKVEQYAAWLEREWPSAAASLRDGLAELFTVNRIGLPLALRRCLTTTTSSTRCTPAFVSTRGASAAGGMERWRCGDLSAAFIPSAPPGSDADATARSSTSSLKEPEAGSSGLSSVHDAANSDSAPSDSSRWPKPASWPSPTASRRARAATLWPTSGPSSAVR